MNKDLERLKELRKLKKLEALNICKNKMVDVFIFLHCGDLQTYNDMMEDERKLTQTEFDILFWALL